jgi:very-short-patch-repair endonuclease
MDRIANARRLRQEQTDAERKLWSILRGRRLDGFKFRRQVPIDRYFADFACFEAKLIVELDGSQHAERTDYDAQRTRVLDALGWRVIRFWNTPVLSETQGVIDAILAELRLARP